MKNQPLKIGLLLSTMGVVVYMAANYLPTTTQEISLTSDFPVHQINYKKQYDDVQTQFDTEMWETFIALCWPADGLSVVPKGHITGQKDGRAIFENYPFNYDLFLLNLRDTTNFKPIAWGDTKALDIQRRTRWAKDCPDLIVAATEKGITNMASLLPLDEFIQASNEAAPHVPLIDQHQNFVWSTVTFNKITYDGVVKPQLETKKGIENAKKKGKKQRVHHVYPEKNNNGKVVYQDTLFDQTVYELDDESGAMHLKTAWKILGEGDDPAKFHTAWAATLFQNVNFANREELESQCGLVQVGLVGMHITLKTADQPNFIWATFEHIDNCPEAGNIEDKPYNFYNYAEKEKDALMANKIPTPNDSTISDLVTQPKWFNPRGAKIHPSQIIREEPITEGTKEINKKYQQALKNTVWANYQLIGTQWTNPTTQEFTPARLANSTLESFDQKGASCMGCHHQVKANTMKGGINDLQFDGLDPTHVGNVLNIPITYNPTGDTAVYSDYMWSLLKWQETGQLSWKQIKLNQK